MPYEPPPAAPIWDAKPLVEAKPAPWFLYPTSEAVHGRACSFSVSQLSNDVVSEVLYQAWDLIGSLELDGRVFESPDDLQDYLLTAPAFDAERTALAFNVHLNELGFYGRYASLGKSQITSGTFEGINAKDLFIRFSDQRIPEVHEAMAAFNQGFAGCTSGAGESLRIGVFAGVTGSDSDGDGVSATSDCDDDDASVGALLYENDFSEDDGWFTPAERITDGAWDWDGDSVHSPGDVQEAMIGKPQNWENVVVYARLSATGSSNPCGNDPGETACDDTQRWRAGIVVRAATLSDDETGGITHAEGYRGYRCALASNAENGCYEDGLFLQIGEFMQYPEDGLQSEECIGDPGTCLPNNTFDQLGRVNHDDDLADLSDGDSAELTFYAVDRTLYCRADAGSQSVESVATDRSFSSGTVGLSTLNMFGDFDHIRVCEAFSSPVDPPPGGLDWEMALGTNLRLADDACRLIQLPFPINYFGINQSQLYINSNGNVTFNGCNIFYQMPQIPHGIRKIVGTVYGDFDPGDAPAAFDEGGVFWNVIGDAPNRRLAVTWSRVPEYSKGGRNTFQVTFFESSNNIQFSYDIVDTNGFNWNDLGTGQFPAMKVGISSGTGAFIRSAEGSQIPGLDNRNICYVFDGIGGYSELLGYCP